MGKIKSVFGFDASGGLPLMAAHVFFIDRDGNLVHEIDGKLRATVPPEGFEAYSEQWPECKDVLAGRVFNSAIDPMKPAIEELAQVIRSDSRNDSEQIAYLQGELAKLTSLQDNSVSVSPADEASPASPVA